MTNQEADAVVESEVVESTPVEVEVSTEVQDAYDRIAHPEKERAATVEEEIIPPPEPPISKELLAQISRIPDLEKQLRDSGGRYGSLKQQLDQIQQRITTQPTGEAVDASELLTDLRDEFPELADKLQGAFEKVIGSKGGMNTPDIDKMVSERMQAEKQSELQEALDMLTEAHPTWREDRNKPEFTEWKDTLPERVRTRFNSSKDPYYVAEMLDQHKEWLATKAKPQATHAQPSKRLAAAVMPSGTRQTPKGEPDSKAAIRAAYERVAGKRM